MARAKGGDAEPVPSKMGMVEQALDAAGDGAKPGAIQEWVAEHYQTEITKQMISSYASQIRKRRRAGKSGRSGPVRAAGGNGRAGGGGDAAAAVRDIATIRELIDRYGAGDLQQLVETLAR